MRFYYCYFQARTQGVRWVRTNPPPTAPRASFEVTLAAILYRDAIHMLQTRTENAEQLEAQLEGGARIF